VAQTQRRCSARCGQGNTSCQSVSALKGLYRKQICLHKYALRKHWFK
jgi:hypothetical protein